MTHQVILCTPAVVSMLSIPSFYLVYHLSSQEREELRVALTAAQESGIIQLLLEICLPNDKDREVRKQGERKGGRV